MEIAQVVVMILMAVSLSAAAGLRAFLPLFAISLLSLSGNISLASGFEWLSTPEAAIVFGLAVILEIAADKIPGLDNALDAVGLVVKPMAAALLSSSLIIGMDPLLAVVLGLIIGGTVAGTIHLGKAKLRAFSTITTAGTGNSVLSFTEDAASIIGTIVSIVVPVLSGALVIALVWWLFRKLFHRRSATHADGVEIIEVRGETIG
jgi:hypothetical protein